MSAGNPPSAGSSLKNFVSEKEIEDRRQKRQEEWEKVRTADQPLECPEEDTRSLYEKLQEQKQRKDDEFEEEQRIRNSVKGLAEEEVNFLNFVSKQQEKLQKQRDIEQATVIQELKDAAVSRVDSSKEVKVEEKKVPRLQVGASKSKSQAQLLMGAVKRKAPSPEKQSEENAKKTASSSPQKGSSQVKVSRPGQPYVKYILPSIGAYSYPSSDSETSSSEDSELDAPCLMTSSLHADHELKRMAVISGNTGFHT